MASAWKGLKWKIIYFQLFRLSHGMLKSLVSDERTAKWWMGFFAVKDYLPLDWHTMLTKEQCISQTVSGCIKPHTFCKKKINKFSRFCKWSIFRYGRTKRWHIFGSCDRNSERRRDKKKSLCCMIDEHFAIKSSLSHYCYISINAM